MFYNKYLKYKKKYLDLKLKGGDDGVCECGSKIYGRHCGYTKCDVCTSKEGSHIAETKKGIGEAKSESIFKYLMFEIQEYNCKDTFPLKISNSEVKGLMIFICMIIYYGKIDFNEYEKGLLTSIYECNKIFALETCLVANIAIEGEKKYIRYMKYYGEKEEINISDFCHELFSCITVYTEEKNKEKQIDIKFMNDMEKLEIYGSDDSKVEKTVPYIIKLFPTIFNSKKK